MGNTMKRFALTACVAGGLFLVAVVRAHSAGGPGSAAPAPEQRSMMGDGSMMEGEQHEMMEQMSEMMARCGRMMESHGGDKRAPQHEKGS